MGSRPDLDSARRRMVAEQIEGRGIRDPVLLAAFRTVPRELFVAPELAERAYDDSPLPIACGQTISQPYIVARMIEAARVGPGDRVLEVGSGSGYAAAVLALLAREVVGIERHPELCRLAEWRLRGLGLANGCIVGGDGARGWPSAAPFDAIIGSACGPDLPRAWLDQLASGGAIVAPVGVGGGEQRLVRQWRSGHGGWARDDLGPVRFVPLVEGDG
ncbi:protein-L-isoaspartate(D-aspartate) O-methyltransferase [Sphingomonas ginkgonis]|uniref:Protein-L-isoaspartate O-methyltransferase n=1 Tax=Sphingomonas ginkgonis TaxID=2315330 RepID=A0A3R9YLK2_9SPHN|nr:protein-L-isoaspartate(D-aspartate) O-methyltransferase [Sphingomonas ginkgonis]RST30282.1 protein-L-isoaspartate(D-aspartate) O-methyltransferase [Sphingomonas ginkgonis]